LIGNLEIMDRSYGVALYYRDIEGELHRIGGFKDMQEAENHILAFCDDKRG